jgi:hypothetical protein
MVARIIEGAWSLHPAQLALMPANKIRDSMTMLAVLLAARECQGERSRGLLCLAG